MMETREPLEWHFKQLDHSMGLSFKTNFNFAIVGHLLKGSLFVLLFFGDYFVMIFLQAGHTQAVG